MVGPMNDTRTYAACWHTGITICQKKEIAEIAQRNLGSFHSKQLRI
jgi:hypothetical protein